jgi:DNA-binding transcriptional regulator YiaG|tara:strand:- start:260 stop:514 length:255 start_codon:yes stop_codon:yes gene_type:complete
MPNNEIMKAVMGQGGALVLACLVLYQVMSQYETLIDTMIQDNKEDRAMYQQNMSELSKHMDKVNETLEKIQEDISSIRDQQGKE